MSLQAEWQYIQRVVPDTEKYMDSIEEALIKDFLPALLGGNAPIDAEFWRFLGLSVKCAGIGILDPRRTAHHCFQTSVACCDVLVSSLLDGRELAYVDQKNG